jgi:hypothetical protein
MGDYNIVEGSEVYVVLRLRGDIGDFEADDHSNGVVCWDGNDNEENKGITESEESEESEENKEGDNAAESVDQSLSSLDPRSVACPLQDVCRAVGRLGPAGYVLSV